MLGPKPSGELGDGTTTDRLTPLTVSGLGSGVAAIATGGSPLEQAQTCALTTAGAVRCWGDNLYGELGDGTTTNRLTPVAVTGLGSGVAAIATGQNFTCALTTPGGMLCWGSNGAGELGDGTYTSRYTPAAVSGLGSGVAAITAGAAHACALTTIGGMSCWGDNEQGQIGDGTLFQRPTPVSQIGDGTLFQRPTPVIVSGLGSGVAAIAAGGAFGGEHSCALTTAGAVLCWGELSLTPAAVSGLGSGVAAIAANGGYACALTSANGVLCWGNNVDGELGDGTTISRPTPMKVSGLDSGVAAISAGYGHACAVTTAGGVLCWGYNGDGELGDGTTARHLTPVPVASLGSSVAAVAAGGDQTCALTTAGGVLCWGGNSDGELGDGTTTQRLTPVAVSGLGSEVAAITAGSGSTCALTTAGGVLYWGGNSDGELGDGTTTTRLTPVPVSGLGSGVAAIATGQFHTCALTAVGGVLCWGYNNFGQLGDGTTTDRSTPVAVSGLGSDVMAIAAGGYHTCALTTASGVLCWGFDSNGQLGDDEAETYATPRTVVAATTMVVEYYNASQDHYFMTWVSDEIQTLDAGTTIKGWTRTGQTFQTYTTAQTGTSPVCRFYIPPALGDSHFYGRGTNECNATAQNNPSFVLEDPAFMQVFLPNLGVCPPNTTEVYRVFDNRPDVNHRYMTDKTIEAQMVAKGWVAEGDGPDLVVMCAPQ